MIIIMSLIEILVNFVETGLYIYLVGKMLLPKFQSKIPGILTLFIGAFGVYAISYFKISFIPDFIYLFLVIFIYTCLSKKGQIWLKAFWNLVGISIIVAIAFLGISIGLLLPGATMETIVYSGSITRVQLLVMCKLIQAIVFYAITYLKRQTLPIRNYLIFPLLMVPLTSLVTITILIEFGITTVPHNSNFMMLLGASLSLLIINITVLILFEFLSLEFENNLNINAKLQQNEMLLKHNEEVSFLYEKMRGLKHDLNNHLQVIHGYLDLKMYKKLDEYICNVEEGISVSELFVNTGNLAIDSIVSSKILLANNYNIKVNMSIQIPPELSISDNDICSLLGNLLDNAIEACQRISKTDSDRFLTLKMFVAKKQLCLLISNSTDGNIRRIGNAYISSKECRDHGIGIKRIDEIVFKYGGYIDRNISSNTFECKILLPFFDSQVQ